MLIPWIFFLKDDQQLFIETPTKRKVVNGPKIYFSSPIEKTKIRNAEILEPTDYLHIKNKITGALKIEKGPKLYFLSENEEVLRKLALITLKHNEYIKIIDKKSGVIRVEKGEKTVYLEPTEDILLNTSLGINLDEHTCVLVRDTSTGNLELINQREVFFPSAKQEIVEIRKKILLEDHETVIIKDKNGKYIIKKGENSERAFFLEPYSKLITLRWSSGIHKDQRNLIITHLDSRPKFMWYELEARTQDNVELIIGITFFWQILEVEKMMKATDDAPGDICSHARSVIIQAISQVTLEKLLASFNEIIKNSVLAPEDNFYFDRGVMLHSVEVRSIDCKEPETQQILQEIIQETTNRINQLQKQESENEVKIQKIKGEILAEKMKAELIEIKHKHSLLEATINGECEAQKLSSFLDLIKDRTSKEEKLNIFNTLRKNDALEILSSGNAQLFFTPSDIDLKIEANSR